jgi:hypothetical protein
MNIDRNLRTGVEVARHRVAASDLWCVDASRRCTHAKQGWTNGLMSRTGIMVRRIPSGPSGPGEVDEEQAPVDQGPKGIGGSLMQHVSPASTTRKGAALTSKHMMLFKTLDEVLPERKPAPIAPNGRLVAGRNGVSHGGVFGRLRAPSDTEDLASPARQSRASLSPDMPQRPNTSMGFSRRQRVSSAVARVGRVQSGDDQSATVRRTYSGISSTALRSANIAVGSKAKDAHAAKKRICIAYSSSSRSFLKLIARMLGWETTEEEGSAQIQWVVSTEQLHTRMRKLEPLQYCARIPGMLEMCNKCKFSNALDLGKRLFPEMFDFWPHSWVLPEQFRELKALKGEMRKWTFIIKPGDGCQGDGIVLAMGHESLMKQLHEHETKFKSLDVVVQQYVDEPMLLKGFKFDLRIYAYIRMVQPLEVYVCREGLARLCTIPYKKPAADNVGQAMCHLTNFSLNKKSENYTWSKSDGDERGTKRTITSAFNELRRAGFDTDEIWKNIDILIARTIACIQPALLAESLNFALEDGRDGKWAYDGGPGCFHIIGVDVLLDNKGNPFLLEINASPRQAIDTLVPVLDPASLGPNEKVCECDEQAGPHVHRVCEIDKKAKTIAVGGAIQILMRQQKSDQERYNKRFEKKLAEKDALVQEGDEQATVKKTPVEFKAVFMGGRGSRSCSGGASGGAGDGAKARRAARVAGTLESHYVQVCSGERGLKDIIAMSCGMSTGFAKRYTYCLLVSSRHLANIEGPVVLSLFSTFILGMTTLFHVETRRK